MNQSFVKWIDIGLFLIVLFPILVSDIKYKKIPGRYVFSGLVMLSASRILLANPVTLWFLVDAAIGFGFIWAFWFFSRHKIGLGDAKLSGLIALLLGLPGWILGLLAASLSGIIYAGVRLIRGSMQKTDRIAFAPFLAFGAAAGFVFNYFFGGSLYELL